MKKIFLLILQLQIIVFIVSGCAGSNLSKNKPLPTKKGTTSFGGDEIGVRADGLQEYLQFLENEGKQYQSVKNMIKYDSIKRIGEFNSFVTTFGQLQSDELSIYHYTLTDQSGTKVHFTITDWSRRMIEKPETKKLGEKLYLQDMRQINETRNGYYLVDGYIQYMYVPSGISSSGILLYIRWDYNGLEFTLSVDKMNEYPYGYDTFVSRMLDANQAGEAVRELMKDIYG